MMSKDQTVKLAVDALRSHKLRSFLTLLGVIIGVATVIAVVSVIQGLNDYVTSRVMEFGSTSFNVTKFSQGFSSLDTYWRESKRRNLTTDDLDAVNAAFIGQVMEIESGRHFTPGDIDHARYEVIIGWDIADRLFPFEDPLGKEMTIDGQVFTVIGVAKKTGSFLGQSQDTF